MQTWCYQAFFDCKITPYCEERDMCSIFCNFICWVYCNWFASIKSRADLIRPPVWCQSFLSLCSSWGELVQAQGLNWILMVKLSRCIQNIIKYVIKCESDLSATFSWLIFLMSNLCLRDFLLLYFLQWLKSSVLFNFQLAIQHVLKVWPGGRRELIAE